MDPNTVSVTIKLTLAGLPCSQSHVKKSCRSPSNSYRFNLHCFVYRPHSGVSPKPKGSIRNSSLLNHLETLICISRQLSALKWSDWFASPALSFAFLVKKKTGVRCDRLFSTNSAHFTILTSFSSVLALYQTYPKVSARSDDVY